MGERQCFALRQARLIGVLISPLPTARLLHIPRRDLLISLLIC